jgi:hypothetical protein
MYLFSPSQVGWIKANDQTVLTLHKTVIINDERVKAS